MSRKAPDFSVDELCELLEARAAHVNADLQGRYKHTKVRWYLFAFNKLHPRHVDTLRQEDFRAAHDILQRIHVVSFKLEAKEFWRWRDAEAPGSMFRLKADAFRNGHLVRMYMDTPYAHPPYACGKLLDDELLAGVPLEAIVASYATELIAGKRFGTRRASAV